ncbi:hypothetical protein F751_2114 [Auxenochlorella protothecoides]|uniref:Uncharacterized protein n=1 Tax=Auxenochlorella protothecoides TaxID=3075 RepID=A0A087SLC3_AUXPR|nr:hypothetical protein F751_2114 [Auxenochlorella protothecoides]KFM26527.1 hypothetical protein F751_2114 [Auxenochlorella protothecoides]
MSTGKASSMSRGCQLKMGPVSFAPSPRSRGVVPTPPRGPKTHHTARIKMPAWQSRVVTVAGARSRRPKPRPASDWLDMLGHWSITYSLLTGVYVWGSLDEEWDRRLALWTWFP